MVWNVSSVWNYIKKVFIIDIICNGYPNIDIISEIFLLFTDNIYLKVYEMKFKTKSNFRKKK